MTESERRAISEYIRRLDDLMGFVGQEELPYSLRTLHMEKLIQMAREARGKRAKEK
jgi:transcription antitermination factor NusG